jgi:hypothetical protein
MHYSIDMLTNNLPCDLFLPVVLLELICFIMANGVYFGQ